jgi:hypothetical protein
LHDLPKHREFLSRFRIFYNQAEEKEMDWHIKSELKQIMELPESKQDIAYIFFPWYYEGKLATQEFRPERHQIQRERLFAEDIRKTGNHFGSKQQEQRKSELDELSIKYKQSAITDMKQPIQHHKAVLIFAPGSSTNLTAAKIHQMLSATKHVILNLQQLIRYKIKVVLAWRSDVDILVLDSQSSTENLQDVFN